VLRGAFALPGSEPALGFTWGGSVACETAKCGFTQVCRSGTRSAREEELHAVARRYIGKLAKVVGRSERGKAVGDGFLGQRELSE